MMKPKIYRSFGEIDTDLKILRLEKEINQITLSQQLTTSVESLSLKNLFSGTWLSFLFSQKSWLHWAIEYALIFLFRRLKK
mgnify:FL=1